MKLLKLIPGILFSFFSVFLLNAQNNKVIPDLSEVNNTNQWTVFNRKAKFEKTDQCIYLNSKDGSGFARLNNIIFNNGIIEADLKGKDEFQRSFLGIAFHGLNDSTYEAIYFRPFNFRNPDRKGHSVQYVSEPENTWFVLRQEHPGEYENPVNPVPDPNDWFHVKVVVNYPVVQVFVNNASEPSLEIDQLSTRKEGWLGLWVGNGSDGRFRNLRVIPDSE
jgi:hypothetical protein